VIGSAAMRTATLWLLLVIGCGDNAIAPLREQKPEPPDSNDPAFEVAELRSWYLIGNATTPGDDRVKIAVTAPSGVDVVDAWVADFPVVRLDEDAGRFVGEWPIDQLPAGTYDVLLAADGSRRAFAHLVFHRSAPYYVMVSTDYDFSDPGDIAIMDMDALHANHPEMRITHFWAPYTYTDPAVTDARKDELTTWVLRQRDTYHDEIGLHIHPYCHFVVDAGIACITDQSTVRDIDTSGYTIKVGAYGRENFGILLDHAAALFVQHGIDAPKTFRAGGWTATRDTLDALVDKGFIADTSALNWARIEEWRGAELYRWNMENWNPIDDTSQPWWPNETDILSEAAPAMPLLEVPDNGVMIDYVSLDEMTGIFDANWQGAALSSPVSLMMGFHPAMQFSTFEDSKVDGFLTYADGHLASRDLGPVVYTTLRDVTAAFPPQ
jgi:hypothetical protein